MQKLPPPSPDLRYADITWTDGGEPYSPDFEDIYFSRGTGPEETRHVFLDGNDLSGRWASHPRDFFVIGELGFGTGLNFLSTWKSFIGNAPETLRLVFVSCELRPLKPADMERIHKMWPDVAAESETLRNVLPPPVSGFHVRKFEEGRITLVLLYAEAESALTMMRGSVDAWFLDGFAPSRNPQMWTANVLAEVARLSSPGATAATYSSSSVVRKGLTDAGFSVRKVPGSGRKKEMITAAMEESTRKTPERRIVPFERRSGISPSVVVVGSGFAGAAAARALAERSFNVTVIDRGVAAGASGGPAAVFYPALAREPTASGRWTLLGSLFLSTRIPQIGLDPACFALGGTLALEESATPGLSPDEVGHEIAADAVSRITGLHFSRGAFQFSCGGWVNGPAWCAALMRHERIRFIDASVHRLERNGDGWIVRGADGNAICESGHVVLAAGESISQFPETAWIPVSRIHGRLIHHRGLPRTQMTVAGRATLASLYDGSSTLGSTFEKEGARLSDSEAVEAILSAARSDFPVPPMDVESGHLWSAVRAASKDYLPVVGPVPDLDTTASLKIWPGSLPPVQNLPRLPGLFVSGAFGARGLAYAALCGELIAAQISGEPLPVESDLVDAIDPGRFVLRAIRRGQL